MIAGIPNAGQVNALATLNIRGERSVTCKRRIRPPSVARPAAARRAAGLRILPPVARCARTRRRARRGVRPQSRSRKDADVRRRVLVQGSVRHQGHALDRRRRRRLRHRLSGARSVLVEQLRNKGAIIFAKAVNTEYNGRAGNPGGRHTARKGAALDARLSAQHLGRQSGQPLRHHALGLARLELRLRRVGQRQSGDGEPRRGNPRVLPRARPTTTPSR